MRVLFSVLSYFPSFITDESINIGILFHNLDNDKRIFERTSNWTRVKHFDDELDLDYFKDILNSIESEVIDTNIFNYTEKFKLERYTKDYVNELRFSEVTYKDVKDLDKFILNTKKIFLRYDFDKSERPSQEQQAKYVKDLLKSNNINYSVKKIVGNYEENIHYDYTIDNYAFKLFTFDNKRLSKLVFSAKSWAYTAKELKDKYKTIFVYDVETEDDHYKTIMNILEESAYKVMKLDEAIEFIFKIRNEKIKVS